MSLILLYYVVSFNLFIIYTFVPLFVATTYTYFSKFVIINAKQQSEYTWKTTKYLLNNFFVMPIQEFYYYMVVQLFLVLSFKNITNTWGDLKNFYYFCIIFFLINIIIFLTFLKSKNFNIALKNSIISLSLWFYLLFMFIPFIDNLITFLLTLELLSIFYYFFFLNTLSSSLNSLIKLKNMLANYILFSFLTMVFFIIGLIICFVCVGTVKFTQLSATHTLINSFAWIFLFFSILWKIGAPGFHFFKLELYQYLDLTSLIFFSLLTIYFNTFILIFFVYNFLVVYVFYKNIIIIFLLLINIFLLIKGYRLNSFYQFLGFSAINTWSTILLMFLI